MAKTINQPINTIKAPVETVLQMTLHPILGEQWVEVEVEVASPAQTNITKDEQPA